MKPLKKMLLCVGLLFMTETALSLPTPPAGKKWQLIDNLSDEFNNGFNTNKWAKNTPNWAGRKPGLFKTSQVTVQNGNLRITADILPPNERRDGWTHAGGLVRSINKVPASFRGYFETRMKANKTFMSSTFWLINHANEETGCNRRVTELDITETVGFNSGGQSWINNTMRRMNSNTHSRRVSCGDPEGQKGGGANLGGLASADYHTYGAWWKSPTEVIFYLDGAEKFRVNPAAKFSLDMYLRMVVETYDWNPPPANGGMNGSFQDRTTFYDWVRSYRLVDDNGSGGGGNTGGRTSVPAKIQAEDYSKFYDTTPGNAGRAYRSDNVDIQTTTDANGGYNVGWIDGNEWLEFPTNVTQAGEYRIDARVASQPGNGMFSIEVDGVSRGNAISVESTGGWQSWKTKSTSIGQLSTGNKTLRIQVQSGNFNLNWIDVVRTGGGSIIDQCDTTQQCKNIFGNRATDCKNSRSNASVCMCGSSPCN